MKNNNIILILIILLFGGCIDDTPKLDNDCINATNTYVVVYDDLYSIHMKMNYKNIVELYYKQSNSRNNISHIDFQEFYWDKSFEIMKNDNLFPQTFWNQDREKIIKYLSGDKNLLLPWVDFITIIRQYEIIDNCNKTAIFWNDAGNSLHQYNLYLRLTKTRK